jgi:hypothetical protein
VRRRLTLPSWHSSPMPNSRLEGDDDIVRNLNVEDAIGVDRC